MASSTEKLRRLAELELLRAKLHARQLAQRTLWITIGALIGLMALAMLAYATFLILSAQLGTINAALTVGGTLILFAIGAIVMAQRAPGRAQQLEAEILKRSLQDARDNLREEFTALEQGLDQISNGFGLFGKGQSTGTSKNLATIIVILNALAALSPTLNRYIQPILKIIN